MPFGSRGRQITHMGYRVIVFSNSCQQTNKPRYIGKYATCYVDVKCEEKLQQSLSMLRRFFIENIISFYLFSIPNEKVDSSFPEVYKCNLNARTSDMCMLGSYFSNCFLLNYCFKRMMGGATFLYVTK